MSTTQPVPELSFLISRLEAAEAAKKISPSAVENVKKWLTEARYAEYMPEVARHIVEEKWEALNEAFWKVLEFGTGGRRGRMYPIGCNAINDRTIGESAQGLAEHVKSVAGDGRLACAIAYDTRHRSEHFAKLCAEIMVGNGFQVYFLNDYRSTPELSYCVRLFRCSCGIMVTASHNPPSDNAVKVYWSTGGQVLPPHDKAIIDGVMNVNEIKRRAFAPALQGGAIRYCNEEADAGFARELKQQSFPGSRAIKIIYSPLHGVGESAVAPALAGAGFTEVEMFGPHREPHPDFPNVPGHVSNPELPKVFDAIIERAKQTGADVILATDPDCDRLGVAAPLSKNTAGPWTTFTGNEIASLLADYVLEQRKKAGTLSGEHYVVKTLVTTEMVRRIADSYGVKTYGNLHVGFKWIGQQMDAAGPEKFVFGCEESHGYLVGQYARDKDGAVAAMLMAELAAKCKAEGQSLSEKLESLIWQHGYHLERLLNLTMEGQSGMQRMQALMKLLREQPPAMLGGMKVTKIRDYGALTETVPGGAPRPLDAPKADMIILDLAPGNYVAVRPSGTEPKVKFYMFSYVAPEQLASLEMTKNELGERLTKIEGELKAVAGRV